MNGLLSDEEHGTRDCFLEKQHLSGIELGSYSKLKNSVLPKANMEGLLSWLCPGSVLVGISASSHRSPPVSGTPISQIVTGCSVMCE